jgi:hypothetical protein
MPIRSITRKKLTLLAMNEFWYVRYPTHPNGKYRKKLKGAFLFQEFGTECPKNGIRPSLRGHTHKLALLLRYRENPMQSCWKDTGKPVPCGAENPDGGGFFFFYSLGRTGTSRDS